MNLFKEAVEREGEKHRRRELNLYREISSLGLTALGEILKLATKDGMAGFPFIKMAEDIGRGKELVVALSSAEGIAMLKDFEIMEFPKGKWGKVDGEGRLLLTPSEFKCKVDGLINDILNAEDPPYLPIEIKL